MCTGRVDLAFVLRAFQKGADGVIVGGCWLGECHYVTEGNYYALNMMHLAKKLLEYAGVNPERLRIEWISASEGVRFAEVMNDFAGRLRELGPTGGGNGTEAGNGRRGGEEGSQDEIQAKLEEIRGLIPYIKIQKKEKLALRLEKEEDYGDLYTSEEVEKIFTEVVSYWVDPEKCQACMICARKCPVEGIIGGKSQIHVIDQELCIRCGTCFDACPDKFDAVCKITGQTVPPPIPEEERTIERKAKEAG
jgi:coenzyme F420-reducing hydrogenase delta subunit/Na+-translocating ferredoxin:NAD+ oxidoreductase RNF subunit RnfB